MCLLSQINEDGKIKANNIVANAQGKHLDNPSRVVHKAACNARKVVMKGIGLDEDDDRARWPLWG